RPLCRREAADPRGWCAGGPGVSRTNLVGLAAGGVCRQGILGDGPEPPATHGHGGVPVVWVCVVVVKEKQCRV
ncbi:unnamed protein product, partial [Amoebophrya sp. A120]